jgi:hypothetical protein
LSRAAYPTLRSEIRRWHLQPLVTVVMALTSNGVSEHRLAVRDYREENPLADNIARALPLMGRPSRRTMLSQRLMSGTARERAVERFEHLWIAAVRIGLENDLTPIIAVHGPV